MFGKTFKFQVSRNCNLIFVPDPDKNVVYARTQDLWSQVPLTLAMLIIRYILEKYCFVPLGRKLKIKDTKRKPAPHNDILETEYRYTLDNNSIKCKNLSSIGKKVDMTERQVERWWRLRRSQDKPSTLVKFTQSMWTLTYVLYSVSFGLYTLWDKEWLWDMDKITQNINSGISNDIWWYYMTSLAFYVLETLALMFWDVRRKDFWQMSAHHLAAIALISLSWIANLYRLGSVVLLLHDSSDIPLELAKQAKWARSRLLTPIFAAFVVTWVTTRLLLFPYWIISRLTEQALLCHAPLIHFLTLLLWLLLAMHVRWTWMIFQIAYNTAVLGQEPEDIRSSCSESEEVDVKLKT